VKPTLNSRNLPVTVLKQSPDAGSSAVEKYDLVGYTCMEGDCLYQGYVGSLSPGDFVLFDNVGAYTSVLRPPFINPAPPMLAHSKNSEDIELIRRRETPEDVFTTYVL
jgi:diaminopimelate decarboxylase